MISPRVAPPMIGLGLLEAVPEDDILAGLIPPTTTRTVSPDDPIAYGRASSRK